ncbi:MAG: hypothetical protein IJO45_06415 [Oscillospiraceae bacterium]|nr:hypothetical protein [Oscillospiraceae bacterium]
MEKLFVWFFFFLYVISMPFSSETEQTVPLDFVAEDLQLDISQGEILENRDTHSGWLGDGESIVILSFTPEEYARLEEHLTEHWKPLPLTKNLSCSVYGEHGDNYVREPMFKDEEGNPLFDPIESGYYYFYDRFSDSTDPYSDSDLFSRSSYNFTLAILDSNAHTLQYLRFDT